MEQSKRPCGAGLGKGDDMQVTEFRASCPFELGDGFRTADGVQHTITNIVCSHYLKENQVEFLFELDGTGNWYISYQEGGNKA